MLLASRYSLATLITASAIWRSSAEPATASSIMCRASSRRRSCWAAAKWSALASARLTWAATSWSRLTCHSVKASDS